MAKGNEPKANKKASTKKKGGIEAAPADDVSSQPKVSADEYKELAPTVDDEAEPIWDIVCVVPKEDNKVCRTEGCKCIAVATWASNQDPDDTWDLCEQCQTNDFGGWPEGYHLEERASQITSKEQLPEDTPGEDQEATGTEDGRSEDTTNDIAEIGVKEEVEEATTRSSGIIGTEANQEPMKDDPTLSKETPIEEESTSKISQNSSEKIDSEGRSDSPPETSTEEVSGGLEDVSDADEELETWDLKKILSHSDISKECPIKCSTSDCLLAGCSIWVSSLKPNEKWYSCVDCQEKDFDGWPVDELPITHMTADHKRVIAEKCSSQKAPSFPDIPNGHEASPPRESGDDKSSMSHTITPLQSSNMTQARKKGMESTVTPSPAVATAARPTQQSKNLLKAHRKWQEQAEAMGGKNARIIVSMPAARKLIFDMLHDAFCPMNITEIHKKLKAVIPSPILKSCLEEMALDNAGEGNPFADSDSDEDEKTAKKKKKPSSDVPYSGSLSFKAGRNTNTCLYFVNHSKLKNSGNGLEPEERNALLAGIAKAEEEETIMKEKLQQTTSETAKLLTEPTNEAAATSLEAEEEEVTDISEKLDAARKLKVNEKHKMQIKKRIASMTAQWRKRKRMCIDFLITMEESTEGTVSMKKCLAGDGQIELDSDEAVIEGAIAFGKRKRLKSGTTTTAGKKTTKLIARNQVAARGGKSANTSNTGIPPSESFVGVRLDPMGKVCRVHIDGDEIGQNEKNKPKPRVSYC